MVKAHFENIHIEIVRLIEESTSEINICVAWFTDVEIYNKLVEKQKQGVKVEVVIANHEFNKKSRVDFKELLKYNGRVGYVGNINDGNDDKLMHNKFCIIDNHTLITGSYNWSYKARKNDENILIIKGEQLLINQFQQKFKDIKPKYGFTIDENKVALLPMKEIIAKWDNSLTLVNINKKPVKNIINKF